MSNLYSKLEVSQKGLPPFYRVVKTETIKTMSGEEKETLVLLFQEMGRRKACFSWNEEKNSWQYEEDIF